MKRITFAFSVLLVLMVTISLFDSNPPSAYAASQFTINGQLGIVGLSTETKPTQGITDGTLWYDLNVNTITIDGIYIYYSAIGWVEYPSVGTVKIDQTTPGVTNGVQDPNNAAYSDAIAMTVGAAAITPGRGLLIVCSSTSSFPGTVTLKFASGNTVPYPVVTAGAYVLPFAPAQITASTLDSSSTYFKLP